MGVVFCVGRKNNGGMGSRYKSFIAENGLDDGTYDDKRQPFSQFKEQIAIICRLSKLNKLRYLSSLGLETSPPPEIMTFCMEC
ncbi:hypothetical protein L1987_11211 [Smallanthus sonchifolius]|uniref:Uncharacterized protein n=1 Tax=Smallanthus sonchifolius TaxID=185202 RepID=A0ACB9JCF9_9ASTR|nr:hypothetical protein L1987_11211 [Smallanthus sonchifolius]